MHRRARTTILCGILLHTAPAGGGSRLAGQSPLPQSAEEVAPDPYHAQKSVEIGQFYLKKGKYDAAIDRFQLAIKYQPNFALPRKLIAETYEKKKDKSAAVEWYRKYLAVLPHAEDADRIHKRIESLNQEIERQKAQHDSS